MIGKLLLAGLLISAPILTTPTTNDEPISEVIENEEEEPIVEEENEEGEGGEVIDEPIDEPIEEEPAFEEKSYTYIHEGTAYTLVLVSETEFKLVLVDEEENEEIVCSGAYIEEEGLLKVQILGVEFALIFDNETNSLVDYKIEIDESKWEDLDENGIPDVIEEYYNSHIRDQYMFGIGLGALLGLLGSIVSVVIMIYKNAKSNQLLVKTNDEHTSIINQLRERFNEYQAQVISSFEEYRKIIENDLEQDKNLIASLEEITRENVKSFQESSELLAEYSKINGKISAMLEAIKALSLSQANVKEGISETVYRIVEEVKKYDEE